MPSLCSCTRWSGLYLVPQAIVVVFCFTNERQHFILLIIMEVPTMAFKLIDYCRQTSLAPFHASHLPFHALLEQGLGWHGYVATLTPPCPRFLPQSQSNSLGL